MLISHSYAQTENVNTIKRLEIGDTLPDITFTNTNNFPSWLKSTKDLKGKLILLDFWGLGCTYCIESFPKMNTLQKEFNNKLQIILVNSSSEEKRCLDHISKLQDPKLKNAFAALPSINGDRRWETIFPHIGVPHHVWIDQNGKVMAITYSHNTTEENITAILNGAKIQFAKKDDLVEYDYQKNGLMKRGHEKLPAPILYSAFLPPFLGLGSGTTTYTDSAEMSYRATYRNFPTVYLYKLTNKKLRLLVETKRVSKDIIEKDEWLAQNCFTYEIKVPLAEKEHYTKYMLEDLNKFFGMKYNIVGEIETRSIPALVIKKVGSENIISQTKKNMVPESRLTTNMEHITTLTGLKSHFRSFENIDQNKIFIDETKISPKEKLDIYLPKDVSNLSAINTVLKKYGLELANENRKTEIMVIKDK